MSLYNGDELVAPSWIDRGFLEKVLTTYGKGGQVEVTQRKNFVNCLICINIFLTNFKIIKYDMSPACMKGDHYGSIMFRCKVEYSFAGNDTIATKSLIIKTLPVEHNKKRELLQEAGLFETEIRMYAETLPKIEQILAKCGEPTKLAPR